MYPCESGIMVTKQETYPESRTLDLCYHATTLNSCLSRHSQGQRIQNWDVNWDLPIAG